MKDYTKYVLVKIGSLIIAMFLLFSAIDCLKHGVDKYATWYSILGMITCIVALFSKPK